VLLAFVLCVDTPTLALVMTVTRALSEAHTLGLVLLGTLLLQVLYRELSLLCWKRASEREREREGERENQLA
jgi:hypothetical protein